MAIAEACQLWIEQRIEEELKDPANLTMSKRALARELAEEIDKYFEVKVNEETLKSRILRAGGSNEPDAETPATTPKSVATSGYKPKPQEVAKRVEALVERGASIREAAKAVAEETGKTPSAVRQAFARERDKLAPEDEPSEAWQFVEIAISQLSRIRKDDPGRKEAFQKLKNWIAVQEGK